MSKAGTSKKAAAARRRLFIEAYIVNGGNATEAAIKAGFSKRSAYQHGYLLLKEPDVAEAIAARRRELQESTGLTTERVLKELARLSFLDIRKLFREDGSIKAPDELDDDTAAALAGIEVEELFDGRGDEREHIGTLRKVKVFDKNSALEKAMKHLGLFEQDNKQTQPITIIATAHDEAL